MLTGLYIHCFRVLQLFVVLLAVLLFVVIYQLKNVILIVVVIVTSSQAVCWQADAPKSLRNSTRFT